MATDPTPETEASPPASEQASGGGKKRKVIVLGAVLLAAALGAGVAYSQFGTVDRTAQRFFEDSEEEATDPPIEYGEFAQLEPLVVNPAETGGSRYLMVSVGLESAEPAVLEEIAAKDIVVRDLINDVLSTKTVPVLSDVGNREALKQEIRTLLNGILSEGEIDRLYFTQFMLQ